MTLPTTMKAMVTTGHGGLDKLVLHTDWPRPEAGPGQVLIRVGACGLNNTDINTRIGWYSKAVTGATTTDAAQNADSEDPSWGGKPIAFPRIQGADVCGRIVAVGDGVDAARIGERVIGDCWLRDPADLNDKRRTGYFGSECDGGFAEYTVMPARNALAIRSDLSDAELATFSCSYSTAEGMLTRAAVTDADTVLVPGASGGVGGALVQLAKRRGARVIGLASAPSTPRSGRWGRTLCCRARLTIRAPRWRTRSSQCWPMLSAVRLSRPCWTCWNAAGVILARARLPGRWCRWICARSTCAT